MKSVLMSIRPQWCNKIFDGEKTIEVRKTRPLIDMPFKVFVYQTKIRFKVRDWQENFQTIVFTPNGGAEDGNGKVIGSFVCDDIISDWHGEHSDEFVKYALLSLDEQKKYGGNKPLYGWHITEPKLFEFCRDIREFAVYGRCAQECSEYDICMKYDDEETRVECPDFAKVPLKRAPQSWCYVEEI